MSLFNWYRDVVKLHSGDTSHFLIDAAQLTESDLMACAKLLLSHYTEIVGAVGVPRGGVPFAAAIQHVAVKEGMIASEMGAPILLVDDVYTTGTSIYEAKKALAATTSAFTPIHMIALFSRTHMHPSVTVLFEMDATWVGST